MRCMSGNMALYVQCLFSRADGCGQNRERRGEGAILGWDVISHCLFPSLDPALQFGAFEFKSLPLLEILWGPNLFDHSLREGGFRRFLPGLAQAGNGIQKSALQKPFNEMNLDIREK